jgi:hypothetical protein
MTRLTHALCAAAGLFAVATLSAPVWADGRYWTDGPVVNAAYIRTVDGHFDDYMRYLSTTYKQTQEAAKKAGLILSYRILITQPHGPQEPDIILVTELKDWAALDHLGGKLEAISTKVEGSVDKSNQGVADRNKIRTILGSRTSQEAVLK